ncbi:alpha/beta hydrolase [Agrobacterium sp. rho-13.3]|uniref:alpha/beta hydrolase n=1 Tax=Agrobacterium sp. rho-13.3 TaxID=3072980 RepID=UPI002A10DC14|nr:alpha/beta hydrolase [Agrobacterium sp. rho-13.3]MDX8306166.1 alpha/beta hydrolase [Agrobacterium sp. rho-13.3]MDX8307503.1 alpha/beta hydrolase [Agrobacterium sp. rho-13.3]
MKHELTRRNLMTAAALAGASSLVAAPSTGAASTLANDRKQEKIVKIDLSFNSGGVRLAGNLYIPDGLAAGKHPAIIVGHPASGVKEQTAGLYAQRLAEQGFITFAFDTATQGESEGLPRGLEDPARRAEEFKDAVSFLSVRADVDPERIGVLGICASGGYVVPAAVSDQRIKAVATVSGVDLGRWHRYGADGKQDPAVFLGLLEAAAQARAAEARGEGVKTFTILPDTREEARAIDAMTLDGWDYYKDRGKHPRSAKEFTWSSIDRTAVVDGFHFIDTISPRPLLMIVGTQASSKWMGEEAIELAQEPKELFWIEGATHVDLYDKPQYVTPAAAKLTEFFRANLSA